MRRLAAIGLTLAATLAAARADIAPPPLQFIDVTAGDLTFLVIAHDYTRPSHPTAQLVGCVDGRPNCALAQRQSADRPAGRRLRRQATSIPDVALRSQILPLSAPTPRRRRSKSTSSPTDAGGASLRVAFARR